jgi:hypothetical protein
VELRIQGIANSTVNWLSLGWSVSLAPQFYTLRYLNTYLKVEGFLSESVPQLRIQYGVRKWERPRGHLFFACNFDRQRTGRLFQCAPKRPQRPTNRQNLTGLASSSLILDRVPLYTVHQNHSSNHSSLLHSAVVDTTLCLNRGIDTAQKPQEHKHNSPSRPAAKLIRI